MHRAATTPHAPGSSSADEPASIRARSRRADRIVYGLFIVVPFVGYSAAALAGHPVIPGDDLVQNEPLRVLAGQIIGSGRIPAWDPLLWSGTPLLAGWNAGAMFPATMLFAILPAIPAWVLNYALVPALGASGYYLFLRRLDVRPLAGALGALVFTYTGFMSGQVVHIGLVTGTALTPWVLVGIDGIARSSGVRNRAGYVALLAGSAALVVLAGDPRAVSSTAVVALAYVCSVAIRLGRRSFSLLVPLAGATLIGAALSAIQWAPGIGFLHTSQRASAAYGFFGAGSLTPATLVSNMLVPFLIGGNGNFGMPTYVGSYNLPELTIGSGLFALAAVGAYLPELVRRAGRLLSRSRPGATASEQRPLVVFFVLLVIGVLLSLGTETPLGHLLVHLPLYGGERLQNRNAAIFDFALAALAAYLLDDLLPVRRERATTGAPTAGAPTAGHPLERRSARGLATIPSVTTVALALYAMLRPTSLWHHLGLTGSHPALVAGLRPYLVVTIALAIALGGFLLLVRRIPPRLRGALAVALVVADVAMYSANAGYGTVPSSVLSPGPLSNALKASIGETGRFAIFNPAYEGAGNDPFSVDRLGVSDLNLLTANASVQGYGSIVTGTYQDATATHLFQDLDTAALNSATFDTLDLRTLATVPIYLDESLPAGLPVPIALRPGYALKGPGIPAAAPDAGGPWPLGPHAPAYFVLPASAPLDGVTVLFNPGPVPTRVTVTAQSPGRAPVTESAAVRGHQATIGFPRRTDATRFEVVDPDPTAGTIGAFLATTGTPRQRYLLDGALQGALAPPHWSYPGSLGPFLVFSNTETAGLAWLQPPTSTTPATEQRAPGTVAVVSSTPVAPQVMAVDAPQDALLVRSADYAPGWTARATPIDGGPTLVLPVRQFGLVQAVLLPAGRYRVTWRYAPTALFIGLIVSGFGLIGFLLLIWRKVRPLRGEPRRVRAREQE